MRNIKGSASVVEPTATDAKGIGLSRRPTPINLPDQPLFTVQPTKSWAGVNPRYLWIYRELLYFMTWRDLKVRYKQAVLGIAWVVLQPLVMTLVFTIVLGRLVKVPSDGIPYPLFAYAGLLIWTFFSGALSTTGNSLVGNANLITKIYFPRVIIPLASVMGKLVDLGVACIILIGLMTYYRVGPTWHFLMVPFLILLVALLSLGLGMWTSAVNVKYRDIGIALPVLIQLWMFISPVLYPASIVPAQWRLLYSLNPLAGIIGGFRAAVFGEAFDWPAIGLATVITLVLLIYAVYSFRHHERTFADLV